LFLPASDPLLEEDDLTASQTGKTPIFEVFKYYFPMHFVLMSPFFVCCAVPLDTCFLPAFSPKEEDEKEDLEDQERIWEKEEKNNHN